MSTEGRCSTLSLARALAPSRARGLLDLFGAFIAVLFLTVGCGSSDEGKPSTGDDQAKATAACTQGQRSAISQKSKTEIASTGDCVARNRPQSSKPATVAQSTSKPEGSAPKSIPGINAEATLTILQKPGLECWQPADREVLYDCSGDENPDLLYEARIRGISADEVSGVEARVLWQGNGHFEQASRPFFGLLSAQLGYRGADSTEAFEFVNRNLSSKMATTTIGAARWTMTTTDDSKELTLTPAS